jgi:translation initiation factor IF-3
LIDHEGTQVGVVALEKAMEMALAKELDLMLVSPESDPPVCKIIDYGQFRYQQRKKEKLAKKAVKSQVIKEIKMSPKISIHDYEVRVNRGMEFLKKGYKIKLTIPFRGREIIHPELGEAIVKRYLESIATLGAADQGIAKAHRSMIVLISPK